MKKTLSCILIACLLFSLYGCGFSGKTQAEFYYCRTDYQYGTEPGVIQQELRDITGHTKDLSYLISLYLAGPARDELELPFPANTRMLSVEYVTDTVIITLSDLSALSESRFSIGCACLAMTCLGLTNADYIHILSADRSITLTHNSLTIYDNTNHPISSTEVSK